MSPRNSVIVALLILVALGAYVYFGGDDGGGGGASQRSQNAASVTVLSLPRDEVTAIAIERRDGTVVRLVRDGGDVAASAGEVSGGTSAAEAADVAGGNAGSGGSGSGSEWRLVEPVVWKADGVRVSSMLGVLTDFAAERVLAEGGEPASEVASGGGVQDLAAYGLDDPEVVVTVSTDRGATRIEIGERTPIGAAYYARLAGEDRIFTVASYRVDPFLRPVLDYRDRSVLSFATSEVRRLEVATGRSVVVAEAEGDGLEWNLVEPLEHPANPDAINELLTPLASLVAQEFIDDPESLAAYGLEEPQAVVRLVWEREGTGRFDRTLYVGNAKDERTAYVKTEGDTVFVVALDPSLYHQASAQSLALMDLVRTNDIFTRHIELHTATGLSLELNKTEEPRIIWTRGDGLVVPPSMMTEFLGALIAIDAQDLGRPLAPGEAESLQYVTLKMEPPPGSKPDAPSRVVRFGAPDENGQVQVVSNDRERIYTVPVSILEELLERAQEILALEEEQNAD